MNACCICGGTDRTLIYRGRIREGRYGHLSSDDEQIVECRGCGARSLDHQAVEHRSFYETDTYRERVDGASDVASYFKNHDAEQVRHLTAVGTGAFRGKVVADVGCGAGSFLHCIEGMAQSVVAIEPSATLRRALEQRGYLTFAYAADAIASLAGRVDIAVSFSVIEHVERPDRFLHEVRELLRPSEGRLVVSTPNASDALLTMLPKEYAEFFYRRAHLWYWTPDALVALLQRVGFTEVVVTPVQRFGIGNFVGWLRDRSPQGEKVVEIATPAVDAVWKSELQRLGLSDYLFASARA